MTSSHRVVAVLQGLTLVALGGSVLLLALPTRVVTRNVSPVIPPGVAQSPPVVAIRTGLTDSVVDANIFSVTREAPQERTFVAEPNDAAIADVTAGEYGADAGVADSAGAGPIDAESIPALHGIVTGPSGRAALLRLDAASAGARLFHLGEGMAGYRVRSIGADRVELSGPAGAVVLELVARGGTP